MKKEGLPRSEILKKGEVINLVLREGEWVGCRYFAIYFLKANERKVAFAASKKIRIKAKKNRAKRLMRELYRKNKEAFPVAYYVFMALPDILTADFADLTESLERVLKALKTKYKEQTHHEQTIG